MLESEANQAFCLGCLIVGHLNALRAEIRDSTFAIGPEYYKARQGELLPNGGRAYGKTDFVEGNLQDILRVRRFLGSDQAHMMDIFLVEARAPYEPNEDYGDTVIVFDGAAGFLKWMALPSAQIRFPGHGLIWLKSAAYQRHACMMPGTAMHL